DVQSLSRSYVNAAGQAVSSDAYFYLTGLTYDVAANLGVKDTNYYRTEQAYDHRGRPNRTVSPTGTITRHVYDGLGRLVSVWVGIDDTPEEGYWSPDNAAGMTKVAEYEYDGGGVGDGNLTRMTIYVGPGLPPRVTDYF